MTELLCKSVDIYLLEKFIYGLSTHSGNEFIRIVHRHIVLLRHLCKQVKILVLRKKVELLQS